MGIAVAEHTRHLPDQKQQLFDFSAHKRKRLEPQNYGVEDGLRSAQCAPAYPRRAADTHGGRTALVHHRAGTCGAGSGCAQAGGAAPAAHIVQMTADGEPVDLSRVARLGRQERLQIRYTGIHLALRAGAVFLSPGRAG